jgi:hypothetical protein
MGHSAWVRQLPNTGGMLALCEDLPRSFELALVSSVMDISVR